ncbi:TRAP transporter large permease [Bacillus sp. FJAT-29790]|uniref:TRAP transporter large permease n=1 Tax=Bacillus sp. FJAT-29790 TaxID=1895002 RepID=UPI001C24C8E3|nr:TRAP transporter large permease [Bacillus sp. FJAT-29790]MBU8877579.1 TRAP transporter large permease [Bacillus sp. FJAT-29790]
MSIAISTISLFALFLAGIPVAFAIIGSTLIYFLISQQVEPMLLVQRMIAGIESVPLLAIPFFIVAGVLMNYTGITRRIANFAEVITGHLPGGLAQVSVVLSTIMGGLSGSGLADAAMQAKMMHPEMNKKGYDPGFSATVIGASSLITPLIPPGIGMILYGYIGNVSIGKLFMAGVVPGLMTCLLMMIAVHIVSKKRGYLPIREKVARPKEVAIASKDAILALILPVIIIGGIRIGVFTPTEAGAAAIVYALLIGFLFYREMKISHLMKALKESVSTSASILLIIAAGSAFGWILTWERIPHIATDYVTQVVSTPVAFLLVLNLFLIILGMFIEGNVAIIILTPLLIPMGEAYGIDPVHLGMVFLFNIGIGTITPPLGTAMFTVCSITKVKIEHFLKEVWPMYIVLFIALMLITFVPMISLWLPGLLK